MNRAKKLLNQKVDFLICILLLLACMNYKQMGSSLFFLINIYVLYKLGFKVKINKDALPYLILMIAIIISGMLFYSTTEILKAINYAFCYISGYNLCLIYRNNIYFLRNILFCIFLGNFGYVLLLLSKNYNIETYRRILIDIWSGEYIAVTLVAVISSVSLGYAIYLLFFETNIYFKLAGVFILLVDFILNFKTATRTLFVLFLIVVIFAYVIKFRSVKNRKKLRIIGYGLIFIIVCSLIVLFDMFSIRTYLMGSALGKRFVETDSMSRIDIFLLHLKNSFEYPLGGGFIRSRVRKAAHNIVQDFYDMYGALASISCLFILYSQIKNLLTLINNNTDNKQEKTIIILLFTMLVQIWTEPIVSGYPIYIWILFFISGITSAYLKNSGIRGEV